MTQTAFCDLRRGEVAGIPGAGKPGTLGRRANFWVSFAVSVHTLWTSAAPALTYRLYAEQWHLSHATTAGIFAIYPAFVVVTLLLLGDLSDYVGRRATMVAGLSASLTGALLFALAPNVVWLFAARAVMGLGVGLASGSSTAAILEYSKHGQPDRAASATSVAQAIGFATALLLSGGLIQYAPWPTRLSFWMLAAAIAPLLVAAWFLPRHPMHAGSYRWKPRMPAVPKMMRSVFAMASIAAVIAFSTGAVLLSLGGQMEHDLVGSSNALVNGAILACFAIVSAVGSILGRALPVRSVFLFGGLASGISMLLLIAATLDHDLTVFLLATVMAGAGYSLLFLGGFTLVNATAPALHRGGVLSSLYLVGYMSMGSVTLLLGFIAATRGLEHAIVIGAGTIACLSLLTCMTAIVGVPPGANR